MRTVCLLSAEGGLSSVSATVYTLSAQRSLSIVFPPLPPPRGSRGRGRGWVFPQRQFQLPSPFPLHKRRMPLLAEPLAETDTVGSLAGGRCMPGAIGSRLHDMHHAASAFGITTDIERICSHQYAPHRIDPRVKLHFRHAFGNRCALVHTAPLNERATDASAFPIANSLKASVYAGDPPCKEGDKSSTLVFLHSRVLFHRLRCDGRRRLHRVLFLHVGSSGADRPPRFARRDAHARCDDCHHDHNLFHNRLCFRALLYISLCGFRGLS